MNPAIHRRITSLWGSRVSNKSTKNYKIYFCSLYRTVHVRYIVIRFVSICAKFGLKGRQE
jgi:hypothetical protein